MANLKQDILNNLGNDKYYTELELARQGRDPNVIYKNKVKDMSNLLKKIAKIDLATQLVAKYFPEEEQTVPPTQNQGNNNPQTQVHPGQTHGE